MLRRLCVQASVLKPEVTKGCIDQQQAGICGIHSSPCPRQNKQTPTRVMSNCCSCVSPVGDSLSALELMDLNWPAGLLPALLVDKRRP